jgi:hypothetical protein
MRMNEIIRDLNDGHIVSFHHDVAGWAGYDTDAGVFVVGSPHKTRWFDNAEDAAQEMATYGLEGWEEVDGSLYGDEEHVSDSPPEEEI